MGSIDRRLRALEGELEPEACPLCSGWFAVHVNGEVTTLTRDGVSADEYQRAEYAARLENQERSFAGAALWRGACPACGERPLVIRLGGLGSLA